MLTSVTDSSIKRPIAKSVPHPVLSGIGVQLPPSSGGYDATVESPINLNVGLADSSVSCAIRLTVILLIYAVSELPSALTAVERSIVSCPSHTAVLTVVTFLSPFLVMI